MKWGCSGTRFGRMDAFRILNSLLEEYGRPEKVIVGDEKKVVKASGSPQMYWDRNQEIADALDPVEDILFALPDSKSTGTYDCARRCKARNIEVKFL
jgi:hypothetical protein